MSLHKCTKCGVLFKIESSIRSDTQEVGNQGIRCKLCMPEPKSSRVMSGYYDRQLGRWIRN